MLPDRIRKAHDEASGSLLDEGSLGCDPQMRGPSVPRVQQAEQRKPLDRGISRDIGRGNATLAAREWEIMLALIVP
jgi:hypothetical protein